MRAQLMEFTAPIAWRDLNSRSALTSFTRSWQSSKTPRTARLWMFGSCSEYICARWNGLMRSCGESMKTLMPRRPRSAYSAAEPVSPEVAPRMFNFLFSRERMISNSLPSNWSAWSLNASVGPPARPSRCRFGSSCLSGAISSVPKVSRV